MLNRLFIIIPFSLIIIGGIFFLHSNQTVKKVHYHAGFLVYIDGKKQDFSDTKYMNLEYCSANNTAKEDDQKEKAHLHDNVGDVVHVHREGAIWGDLFKNIDFAFPDAKPLQGYVNGKPVKDILRYPIQKYDSVLITAGDSSKVNLKQYVLLQHIEEVEKSSETCGT